eukprot:m.297443 g.297443  ORF g.297443 m.297443 type:complete len:193 (-) comp15858_c6_seq31:1109-1687(-)
MMVSTWLRSMFDVLPSAVSPKNTRADTCTTTRAFSFWLYLLNTIYPLLPFIHCEVFAFLLVASILLLFYLCTRFPLTVVLFCFVFCFCSFLPSLLNRVDSKISKLLLPEEDCRMMPPSMLTIHVDLLPLPDQSEATSDGFPSDATYRISKSWDAVCPQGPEIKMRNWGHILHPIPTPSIPHRVCFAVTLRIS